MKKLFIICSLFFLSCSSKIEKDQLHLLTGYWEIKEVIFKDGTKKEYKVNGLIDYIEIDSLAGFRKKVTPKFDGSYETASDPEAFDITAVNDSIYMNYNLDANTWTEVLIKLSEDSFSVKNDQGLIYHYNRFEPININP